MKIIILIVSIVILSSCENTKTNLQFKGDLSQTGVYEEDKEGIKHLVLDNKDESYFLKKNPTIGYKKISDIYPDEERCYPDEICISVVFTEEGMDEYTELTKRNLHKQIFFVIDGVIINAPYIKEVITFGSPTIFVEKKYFDSLFIANK